MIYSPLSSWFNCPIAWFGIPFVDAPREREFLVCGYVYNVSAETYGFNVCSSSISMSYTSCYLPVGTCWLYGNLTILPNAIKLFE